ncbi:MAG TPA: PQQ-binding-like beta-propeller repeat protein [Bacteroidales bacterium]|nr:PQQ-binding-like beta-propeller repeat protein [Bacteroidales bacterium]
MKVTARAIFIAAIIVFINFFSACTSQVQNHQGEWPQWMGPNRDATWSLDLEKRSLDTDDLEKVWEAEIGTGYCSPTVADNRTYVMDYQESPVPSERVLCYNAGTGEKEWEFSYETNYTVGYPTGPRASVLIHGGKAYSYGTMGELYCLDAKTGSEIWHVNGKEAYDISIPVWGLSSSPIIVDDKLIVQIGGEPDACMVAFNKDTGEELWRALPDRASYSSPILIEQAGKQVLVIWTGDNVTGLNPHDGSVYWVVPFRQSRSVINIAMPVIQWPYMFLSCFYDGSMLIKLSEKSTSASMVWHRKGESVRKTDALHCIISTPFIQGDHIYGVDSYGEFRCLDLMTGDRIWKDQTLTPYGRWSNAHFAFDRDRFWAFNEKGELVLGKVSPAGFTELGRAHLIDPVRVSPNPRGGVNWAFPAFAGRNVFVRSDAQLICYSLKDD